MKTGRNERLYVARVRRMRVTGTGAEAQPAPVRRTDAGRHRANGAVPGVERRAMGTAQEFTVDTEWV